MRSRSPRRGGQTNNSVVPTAQHPTQDRRKRKITALALAIFAAFALLAFFSAPAKQQARAVAASPSVPPDMTRLNRELAYAGIPRSASPVANLARLDGYSEADATHLASQVTPASTTTSITTDYVYDGQNMVREMRSGVPTATYLTGPRGPEYRRDDTQTETDGQGHTFGKTRWYVYDGLGSVAGEVDPLGNLTSSPKYDVYGAVRGNGGTASTRHGFVGDLGHLSEPETGLIYMKARYMDPQTGRFVSQDSARSGQNWFAYCGGNPVSMVDRTGKEGELMSTIGSSEISATLDGIGSDFGVELEGDVASGAREGSGGTLNWHAEGIVNDLEDQANAGRGTWEYWTKPIADGSGNSLKAWVRYNERLEIYDLYLNDWGGEEGAFSHPVPYAGPMH